MLLGDLEVARRLYRDEEGEITHEFDDLPIGVAIAVINGLIETDPKNWHFQMDNIYQIFLYSAENRRVAIKDILKNQVFDLPTVTPKAAIGQVRVKCKRYIDREKERDRKQNE
jgi:hypothetical protein